MKWIVKNNRVIIPSEELNIHPAVYTLLHSRGLKDEEIVEFLNPDYKKLYSPFLFQDMEKILEKIMYSIKKGERILIYGDYDVDGTTSVALLYSLFKRLRAKVDYYIPHRLKEGYGLSKEGIDYAISNSVKLIITVDCGISALGEIEYAKKNGIDVIVTDHHEPGSTIPSAFAILDPKLDTNYPFRELAGVGVAFKLALALSHINNLPVEKLKWDLDLVALGTIADVVPLYGENRILSHFGLKVLNRMRRPGLRALAKVAGVTQPFTSYHVGFIFGPRINAIGRLRQAKEVVTFLTSYDENEVKQIAEKLHTLNEERKKIEKDILLEALETADKIDKSKYWGLVLSSEGWHEGVIGIVASRVVEKYNRPTIIISFDEEIGKGSGRSIPEFHLYEGLKECAEFLVEFGGHREAAGLIIKKENLDKFTEKFNDVVKFHIKEEDIEKKFYIDLEIDFDIINKNLVEGMRKLMPFGPSNTKPVFIVRNVEVVGYPDNFSGEHIKFKIRKGKKHIQVIGFNSVKSLEVLKNRPTIDLVFYPEIDKFNNDLMLRMLNFKIGGENVEEN